MTKFLFSSIINKYHFDTDLGTAELPPHAHGPSDELHSRATRMTAAAKDFLGKARTRVGDLAGEVADRVPEALGEAREEVLDFFKTGAIFNYWKATGEGLEAAGEAAAGHIPAALKATGKATVDLAVVGEKLHTAAGKRHEKKTPATSSSGGPTRK